MINSIAYKSHQEGVTSEGLPIFWVSPAWYGIYANWDSQHSDPQKKLYICLISDHLFTDCHWSVEALENDGQAYLSLESAHETLRLLTEVLSTTDISELLHQAELVFLVQIHSNVDSEWIDLTTKQVSIHQESMENPCDLETLTHLALESGAINFLTPLFCSDFMCNALLSGTLHELLPFVSESCINEVTTK
ncbi:hypothetical protein [Neptuniibacter sp. QD37_11]|uniref:hypothetical protein n=1 Tax=Neptuniibacter sp. QD37_11 TaxID=3398209 RepID=UPI0039F5A89E